MNRFEPPPLPGESRSSDEPGDPYGTPSGSEASQPYAYGGGTQPGYGYGAAPQAQWGAPALYNHPKGTTVLVLGILSVVALPLLGPFAWIMGRGALKEVDASQTQAANRSSLMIGMVLGIVGTVLMVLGAVLLFLLFTSIIIFSADVA